MVKSVIQIYQQGFLNFWGENAKIGIEKILMPSLPSKKEREKVFGDL